MEKVQYKKSDFYYDLPEERIAQTPAMPRDSSRLLVYDRATKQIEDKIFRDITEYLQKGDLLVVNNTKVIPARVYAKTAHGGAVEILLLKRLDLNVWEVLMRPGKKGKIGVKMTVNDELSFTVKDVTDSGERIVEFAYEGAFEDVLSRVGTMPLPPYIKEKLADQSRYNTVYSKVDGSAAAPTATGIILKEMARGPMFRYPRGVMLKTNRIAVNKPRSVVLRERLPVFIKIPPCCHSLNERYNAILL